MRTLGICASLLAASQLLFASSPAYANEPPASSEAPVTKDAPADTPSPDAQATAQGTAQGTSAGDVAPEAKRGAPSDGLVDVHIDSPHPVSLEKRDGPSGKWEFVCTAPCEERQSVAAEYRIVGTDLNDSKPFTLDGSAGRVVLKVTPGVHNKGERGKWILVGSGALAAAGVLVLALGSNTNADATGVVPQANSNAIFIGSAMLLAGLSGAILGGSWWVNNTYTGVVGNVGRTVDEKSAPAGAPSGVPGVKGEFKLGASKDVPSRAPTFSSPKTSGLPAYVSIPVFGTTF